MTITPEIIKKALEASKADDSPVQDEFFKDLPRESELVKALAQLSAAIVKAIMSGDFQTSLATSLVLVFIGYAIAKEEAATKEVAVAGAIQ